MTKNLIKVALLSGLIISTSIAYADEASYPDDLRVDITNLGAENCILTKQVLLEGVIYKSHIPFMLPADGERYYFTLSGESTTNLILNYQCGDYKKITLHMTQYHKKNHKHTSISAYTSNVLYIFEKHTSKVTLHNRHDGYRYIESGHAYPGTLSWQLYN